MNATRGVPAQQEISPIGAKIELEISRNISRYIALLIQLIYRVMRAHPVDPFQKANAAFIWKTASTPFYPIIKLLFLNELTALWRFSKTISKTLSRSSKGVISISLFRQKNLRDTKEKL
jgi:hypothetical protein